MSSKFYPFQLFQDMADAYVGALPRLVFIQGHESEINKLKANSSFPLMFLCEDANLMTIRSIRQGLQEVRFRMYLLRQTPAQGQGLGQPQSNVQTNREAMTAYHSDMQLVADQMVSYLRFEREDLSSQVSWETKPLKAQSTAFLTGVQVDCTLTIRDAYCETDFVPAQRTEGVRFLNQGGTYAGFVRLLLESNEGASIYYTLDGSVPSAQNGTLFDPDSAVFITETTQVRAIAYLGGLLPSFPTSTSYIIIPITASASPQGGEYLQGQLNPIALGSNSESATIRYTLDGTEPTESSALFVAPIPINVNTELRYRAFDPPAAPSIIYVEEFDIKALAPTLDTQSGVFISQKLVSATNNNPLGSNEYRINSGSWIAGDSVLIEATSVVEFRTVAAGVYITSDIVGVNVEIQCAAVVFDPNGGLFEDSQEITMASATSGVTIYYTLDGSEPTTSSPQYNPASKPTINADTTAKALAVKSGLTNSVVSEAQFTLVVPVLMLTVGNATTGNGIWLNFGNGGAGVHRPAPVQTNNIAIKKGGLKLFSLGQVTDSPLYYSDDFGVNWIASPLTTDSARNWIETAKEASRLAIGKTGSTIICSDDDGLTFYENTLTGADAGASPTMAKISSNGQFWCVFGDDTLPSKMNGIKLSDDFGETWYSVFPNGTNKSMRFGGQSDDGQTIYVGIPTEGVYRSTDRGQNWTLIFNAKLSIHAADCNESGEILYIGAGTSNDYDIYRSLDGGDNVDLIPSPEANAYFIENLSLTGQRVALDWNTSRFPRKRDSVNGSWLSLPFGTGTFRAFGRLKYG